METKEILRSEYRRTWEAFSRHMKVVHQLTGSAKPEALKEAMREAELALGAHKDARDNLAALLAQAKPTVAMWSTLCPVSARCAKQAVTV